MPKLYVVSGELRGIISCKSPLEGCAALLNKFGNGKTLDSTFFCLDERGFREKYDCQWTIPVSQVLKKGGFV